MMKPTNSANRIRRRMCAGCPYAKDCPSGVWSAEDYAKLPPYDAETFRQPIDPFACHEAPALYCHGWAMCHENRGHGYELISLRFRGSPPLPAQTGRPHFASGTEAAAHGMKNIKRPKRKARRLMEKLLAKHGRLREEGSKA